MTENNKNALVPYVGEESPFGLPDLTHPQMNFVLGIIAGKNGSDAYRAAYNAENMSNESIWVEASRLRSNTKVALWLQHAKEMALIDISCTREAHLRELERLKALALQNNNMVAAINCEHLRGKVCGLYVELRADVTPPDPIRTLNEIARLNPELAQALAVKHNIAWQIKETVH